MNTFGIFCLKLMLATSALFEFSLLFVIDFARYEFDLFVITMVACMTLFSLFRLHNMSKRGMSQIVQT